MSHPSIRNLSAIAYAVAGLLAGGLLFFPQAAAAGSDAEALRRAFEESVKAEGTKLGDYTLVDQDGASFRLGEYITGDKPTVLSFIYTSCPDVCPTITADIKRVAAQVELKYGPVFRVLTIGFDAQADTPERLREYGARFVKDFSLFRFAAADEKTIKALTGEAGFYFKKNPDEGGHTPRSFDHIDMVTVIRPGGTVYKQVYGVRSRPEALAERLAELIEGRPFSPGPVSVIEKLRYFCYKYDPVKGRYVPDYPVIASIAIQALVIGSVIYFVWGNKKRRRGAGRSKP